MTKDKIFCRFLPNVKQSSKIWFELAIDSGKIWRKSVMVSSESKKSNYRFSIEIIED